jgi:predicted alpha/beta hydrolase family esterase
MESTIFILPGLFNSGPQHWQTHWENEYGFTRIHQQDWETPVCEDWIRMIDATIMEYPLQEVVLVAHSLANCTIAHWANKYNRKIKGALMVAPSDMKHLLILQEQQDLCQCLWINCLSSIVIASSNDEYVSLSRAKEFADAWEVNL